jgi:transcriptional regulator with XRE-family HTH domain
MRQFPLTLQQIIQQSGLNLNNISQASGVSNAYLAKLSRNDINRPGKDKIASILLSLNHTISEINRVLSEYDYQPLHLDDIPDLLENNRSRKIIGGNLPQYDHIYFDLLLVALERIGGNKILVKNRPSGVFMPHELYLMKEYPYESNDDAAVFRYNLTQQILQERQQIFQQNLKKGFFSSTYICRDCFSEFLNRNIGKEAQRDAPRRSRLTVQYIANALSLSLKRPQQHKIFLIERCPYFHFMIQDADGDTPKVSYPGRKLHAYNNEFDKRMLEGFTTDLPHIVSHFRHELDMCSRAVKSEDEKSFPVGFQQQLFSAFQQHGLKEQLQESLDTLMAEPELKFY